MKVGIYSPYENVGLTTVSTLIPLYCASNYDFNIMLTHTGDDRHIKKSLGTNKQEISTGLDDIHKVVLSNRLGSADIQNYCYRYFDRMDLLTLNKETKLSYSNSIYSELMKIADDYYKFSFIRIRGYVKNLIEILTTCDKIIVVVDQDKRLLTNFFKYDYEELKLLNKEFVIVINRYNNLVNLKTKQIKKIWKVKEPVLPLAFSPYIQSACNSNNLLNHMYQINGTDSIDEYYEYINQINRILEWVSMPNIDLETFKQPILKVSFFEKLKSLLKTS